MFDNRKQNVPQLFVDKMNVDRDIALLMKENPRDFRTLNGLRKLQKEIRKNCHIFCVSKKVDPESPGTPAGGTVGRYTDTYAIAA